MVPGNLFQKHYAFLSLVFAAVLMSSCSSGGPKIKPQASDSGSALYSEGSDMQPAQQVEEYVEDPNEPERIVEIETDYGTMVAKLYNGTPKHRDNFIKLAEDGFYDDLLFHRVMNRFMIQGGDPDSKGAPAGEQLGSGGPGYTVPAEFTPRYVHKKGALCAARQPDQVNPQKASSGSQFYIVHGTAITEDNWPAYEQQKFYGSEQKNQYIDAGAGYPPLDGEYTVFGEVISGLEVIDQIAAVKVDPRNRPEEDVKMKVRVIE
jgi:peptidyl-prolyl cis-trans isomerase B (cyclophilin B)